MRYIYLTIGLIFGSIFAQDKISLENVLDGTFRTESIGRYDWKNSSDAYYFSKRSDEGLDFYEFGTILIVVVRWPGLRPGQPSKNILVN